MLLRLYRSPAVLLQITGERLKGAGEHKEKHHHANRPPRGGAAAPPG